MAVPSSRDANPEPRVILKPRKARPFFARHPWVFAGSIDRVEGDVRDGSDVRLVTDRGQFVARGLFNSRSVIRVRLYRWEDEPLDAGFWQRTVERAIRLRHRILGLDAPGAACRLIASEGDGLSGLTVDRFDRWLIVQFSSRALADHRDEIIGPLASIDGISGVRVRSDRSITTLEGLDAFDEDAIGSTPTEPIVIRENDLEFLVDLQGGQKTGWYLDQRENRRVVSRFADGRRVLDLFCYTGGFSLTALKFGQAAVTLGVDSSAPAIELARRNAERNGLTAARFEQADVFETLAKLRAEGDRFGMVICDPPKFARSQRDLEDALNGYLKLNRAAVEVLEPDGLLVACSCSGAVTDVLFADLLGRVAERSGRTIQILDRRGQALDHPVSASCLESSYLKCYLCRVA